MNTNYQGILFFLIEKTTSLKKLIRCKSLTLSRATIFRSSKSKEFADNSKLDESGRKFFETDRKHCGKGEIAHAHYEQFLLFPQCFQ